MPDQKNQNISTTSQNKDSFQSGKRSPATDASKAGQTGGMVDKKATGSNSSTKDLNVNE